MSLKKPALVRPLGCRLRRSAPRRTTPRSPRLPGSRPRRTADQERTFEQAVPNGDRLRIRVMLQPRGGEPEAIAKGPALEEGDQIRDDTRQAIKSGASIGRLVLRPRQGRDDRRRSRTRATAASWGSGSRANPIAFAVTRGHPREGAAAGRRARSRRWRARSRNGRRGSAARRRRRRPTRCAIRRRSPLLGGDQIVRLTGGGDLEIQVPAFWGRANLKYADRARRDHPRSRPRRRRKSDDRDDREGQGPDRALHLDHAHPEGRVQGPRGRAAPRHQGEPARGLRRAPGGCGRHAHALRRPRRGDARHAHRDLGAVRREARERNARTAGARCS